MPPDRESPYGQPYGEGHGEGYPYSRSPYRRTGGAEDDPYAQPETFQAAVDALSDPLSDPLPGQGTGATSGGHGGEGYSAPGRQSQGQGPPGPGRPARGYQTQGHQTQGHQTQGYRPPGSGQGLPGQGQSPGYGQDQPYGQQPQQPPPQKDVSPWFRPHREPGEAAGGRGGGVRTGQGPAPGQGGQVPYRSALYEDGAASGRQQWRGPRTEPTAGPGHDTAPPVPRRAGRHGAPTAQTPAPAPPAGRGPAPGPGARTPSAPRPGQGAGPGRRPGLSETAALPVVGEAGPAAPAPSTPARARESDAEQTHTVGLRRPDAEALGRAARRRAAQRRGGRGSVPREPEVRPLAGTRLEARRAARARREGPAIIASRFLGEVFISAGVLMLLFVAYQLWWTNVLAGQEAGGAAEDLAAQWDGGGGGGKDSLDPERRADDFAPGEGFAILYIPKLDVRVPIAQGVSKPAVLDKGLVGHYDKEPVKSGMPWDKTGNFALAGHRNTHGEPFRYINRLVAGDKMVVETGTKFYTYQLANRLPSTSPSNTGVIEPIPKQSGFTKRGRYITLTTCTPEFTSKYRLIVWGKMVEERPRSKGKPDALVG
ncbi:class E sortase [Streptomyces ovatisporus]|uniref:Class E sortase n=1 Tax=Streptomyces ovatisporus TaxID=1128682 RepID=A0ABV9A9P0_9ACTN